MGLPTDTTTHLKFPISWEQLWLDAKTLADKIKEERPAIAAIIAVSRGGLIPAAIIAYELQVKFIDTVCVSSYGVLNTRHNSITLKPAANWDAPTTVVVDDLVDTGRTFEHIRLSLPRAFYAAVYAKPLGRPSADLVVAEVSQETWIDFPWE